MKIIIPGGRGQIGQALVRAWRDQHEVWVLSRGPSDDKRCVQWDGETVDPAWSGLLEGADVVVNLAGRSVNCRYTARNLKEMLDSRVRSTEAVGKAIRAAEQPPKLWLQMSTATIYAHTFGEAHDESGVIGGEEPDVPEYWANSIEIARAWEQTVEEIQLPETRKVILRAAMVMGPARGGIYDTLCGLTRKGLGGALAGGKQWMSWIHERDFISVLEWLIAREDASGVFNVAAPHPVQQRRFQEILRSSLGVRIGLPATKWMLEIGALFMATDTELVLKSRRVVPGRLQAMGFNFALPTWEEAAEALAKSVNEGRSEPRGS